MSEVKETFFTIPDIDSVQYKKTKETIIEHALNFQKFTDNLQQKIDSLLKGQMTQFIRAYRLHMFKVQEDFRNLQVQLKNKQIIIRNYQNEGQMAILMERVKFLELQEKKNQQFMESQKKKIKEFQVQKAINQSQNKRLSQKLKQLMKTNAVMDEKILSFSRDRTNQSIPTFSTQISPQKSGHHRISKMLTQQKSYQLRSLHQKSEFSINPERDDSCKLLRQVTTLRKKNRELASLSTRYFDSVNEMEQFFIKTVNQIKKVIVTRKGIQECTLQDFRMQDKLQLLIKILSNDKLIMHLYESIFGQKKKPFFVQFDKNDSTKQKIKLLKMTKNKLPNIKSSRYN